MNSVRLTEVAWAYHESEELGVSVSYPGGLAVSEELSPDGLRLHFLYWGPTQRVSTEFYDGMSFTISRAILPAGQTFDEFVARKFTEVSASGVVLEVISSIEIDGRSGLQFGAFTDGAPFRRAYVPASGGSVMIITVAAPDPTDQGYEEVIEEMFAGLTILNS